MSFIGNLIGTVTGVLPEALSKILDRVLPDKLTEEEKAQVKAQVAAATREHELTVLKLANEADAEFNRRIVELEGTAKDLKAIPIIGPIVLLLRGAFRPLFAYGVLIWDWKMFSGDWMIQDREIILAINVLVLGFFFGERAVKNVMPLLTKFRGSK